MTASRLRRSQRLAKATARPQPGDVALDHAALMRQVEHLKDSWAIPPVPPSQAPPDVEPVIPPPMPLPAPPLAGGATAESPEPPRLPQVQNWFEEYCWWRPRGAADYDVYDDDRDPYDDENVAY